MWRTHKRRMLYQRTARKRKKRDQWRIVCSDARQDSDED
jgi:hypothetical protein